MVVVLTSMVKSDYHVTDNVWCFTVHTHFESSSMYVGKTIYIGCNYKIPSLVNENIVNLRERPSAQRITNNCRIMQLYVCTSIARTKSRLADVCPFCDTNSSYLLYS